MKFVVWFGDVDKRDGAFVGGKGANLGELTRASIPVPSGYLVTSEVYASATNGSSRPDTSAGYG